MSLFMVVVILSATTLATVALIRRMSDRRGLSDPHGLIWQLAGLVTGVFLCAAVVCIEGPRHPLTLALPALAGSCWLLGVVAAERSRPRAQRGTIRVAGLVPRAPSLYVAPWAYATMRTVFLTAAALSLASSALGSPSGATRYSATTMDGITRTYGPWPGWYYTVPALISLVFGWVMTEWAIRTITGRPPLATGADADGRARVQAARAALTAACLMALPVVGALLLSMGAGLVSESRRRASRLSE